VKRETRRLLLSVDKQVEWKKYVFLKVASGETRNETPTTKSVDKHWEWKNYVVLKVACCETRNETPTTKCR
jgi:hypothetical protein